MLQIWWYNRGLFPLGNKSLGSLFEWVKKETEVIEASSNWEGAEKEGSYKKEGGNLTELKNSQWIHTCLIKILKTIAVGGIYEEFYRKNELSTIFDIFKVRAPSYNAK